MFKTTVTIKGGNPYRSIEMSMAEYIGFIKGQAHLLGLLGDEELPIHLVGFDKSSDCDCEGCEFVSKIDGLCDLHMDPDYEDRRNK